MHASTLANPLSNTLRASVIITSYNRREALLLTLEALGHQTLAPEEYEVLVVVDGSMDGTFEALERLHLPCDLRLFRQPENRGISDSRNLAIARSRGTYLVMVSDDLIVPTDFLATHLETHSRYPGSWVVGGIRQLDSTGWTPFGRYLNSLETCWEKARKSRLIAPSVWELSCPTARNLSLPRCDLEHIGMFDARFRTSCEDQDLAERAAARGVRFLYNETIECLHNDQVSDFRRFCRAQVARTRDTALFCHKWATRHGNAPVSIVNGYICHSDSPVRVAKKVLKSVLATPPVTAALEVLVRVGERGGLPDSWLCRWYQAMISLYMFRGWREGLALVRERG